MPSATYKFPDGRKVRIDYDTPDQLEDAVAQLEGQSAPQAAKQYNPADEMNAGEKFLVGVGRGFTDVGQALSQTVRHALPGDIGNAKAYDQQIAQEAGLYDAGLGDSFAAGAGRFLGNAAPTIPLGLGAGALARGAAAGRVASPVGLAAIEGGAAGASSALTQPVLGGDFATGKAGQVALGATLGGVLGGGAASLGRGVEGAVNLPANIAGSVARQIETPSGQITRSVLGAPSAAQVNRGLAVAERTGVDLTPAQISGSKAGTAVENLARQSIFTADEAFKGDMGRARQLINAVKRTAQALSKSKVDPASIGTALQGAVDRAARTIAGARSAWGRRAYGAIDKAAGGAKIVGTQNLRNEMAAILKENEGVVGGDSAKIAAQIRAWLGGQDKLLEFGEAGRIAASSALRQVQAFGKAARGEQSIFADLASRGPDRVLARRLYDAMMRDMDDSAAQSGGSNLGAMLRRANEGWKRYSQELDALENSALGGAVGDDFASEIVGVAFNKVPPERVFQRIASAQPSEIAVVKKYLEKFSPDVWSGFQRARLTAALDAARIPQASAGRALPMDPARFINELTGGAGAKGKAGMDRLKAIYGDSDAWPAIQDLLDVSRRMGDSFGKNYSNTAIAQQALGAMDRLTQFTAGAVKQGLGGAATMMGLKQYTRQAMNGQAPQLYQLPPIAGSARRIGAAASPIAPLLVPGAPEEQQ